MNLDLTTLHLLIFNKLKEIKSLRLSIWLAYALSLSANRHCRRAKEIGIIEYWKNKILIYKNLCKQLNWLEEKKRKTESMQTKTNINKEDFEFLNEPIELEED